MAAERDESTLDVHAAAASASSLVPELPVVDPKHYEREDEIARGGIGRIVAAIDRRLGRRVALKELLTPAPAGVARFKREIEVTARLTHPGVVALHEAGVWPDGTPFFAMVLVKG